MTPIDFAQKHLGQYRTKGAEIIPVYCPFCKGGKSHDKHTFALNVDNFTYNCRRGTCGVAGTFRQLLDEFGETEQKSYELGKRDVEFKAPTAKLKTPKEKVESYLALRGFSKETWESWQVGEVKGNIAFPYYEDGQLVLLKYRKPEKYTGKGQKAWREPGGKAVFWGLDGCDPTKPLTIVEGEFDALTLTECGITNVVSVPSGAEDLTCIDHCWDWLQKFKRIIIWPDNDTPGQEMCRKLITKLGAWRCLVVECPEKDANIAMHKHGKIYVKEIHAAAKEVPVAGLVRLSEVKAFDLDSVTRIKSSVGPLNKYTQGYMSGQLTVVTGMNGSGKSTWVGQELIEAIDQGFSVCAYSGELPAPVFRYWIDLQIAGADCIEREVDKFSDTPTYRVKPEYISQIREWYKNSFFLYDNYSGESDEGVMDVFRYAAMRYDCKVFLIDNLMAIDYTSNEREFNRRQADYIKSLKKFVNSYDVHLFLVAHPRKTDKVTKQDVSGVMDITNWADNVISIHRPEPEESQEYSALLNLHKSRWSGHEHKTIGLHFDTRTKRLWSPKDPKPSYGWSAESWVTG